MQGFLTLFILIVNVQFERWRITCIIALEKNNLNHTSSSLARKTHSKPSYFSWTLTFLSIYYLIKIAKLETALLLCSVFALFFEWIDASRFSIRYTILNYLHCIQWNELL